MDYYTHRRVLQTHREKVGSTFLIPCESRCASASVSLCRGSGTSGYTGSCIYNSIRTGPLICRGSGTSGFSLSGCFSQARPEFFLTPAFPQRFAVSFRHLPIRTTPIQIRDCLGCFAELSHALCISLKDLRLINTAFASRCSAWFL